MKNSDKQTSNSSPEQSLNAIRIDSFDRIRGGELWVQVSVEFKGPQGFTEFPGVAMVPTEDVEVVNHAINRAVDQATQRAALYHSPHLGWLRFMVNQVTLNCKEGGVMKEYTKKVKDLWSLEPDESHQKKISDLLEILGSPPINVLDGSWNAAQVFILYLFLQGIADRLVKAP